MRQPWRVLGNASPMARMLVPDLAALGVDPKRNRSFDPAKPASPDLMWTARWTLPFYTDTWDGYPAARERLYDLCRGVGADDLLVLTGDSHSFWMNQLKDAAGRRMGLEIGTAGVTSPGDFVESGWDDETARRLDRAFETLDEVVWTDNFNQGYVRVELTHAEGAVAFVAVDTVLSPDYRTRLLRTARIQRRGGSLAFA
jgi:phosphodiesterase/alkaline phosphatase D-like protein